LEHEDGTCETLDPGLLPLPIDTDPAVTLGISEFKADPTLRVATAFLRQTRSS
jgi:hypothetical protein